MNVKEEGRMIKKIKIEIQEERHKRTYKNAIEVKAGSMSQENMKELASAIADVLKEFGLINETGEDEE